MKMHIFFMAFYENKITIIHIYCI